MSISDRDRTFIWHPFTQMKLQGTLPAVERAEGNRLYLEDGRILLDMISSWWVNVHGHTHPFIAERISRQVKELEQVIFAGFTHAPAVELAERILKWVPGDHEKVFFSDNGSTSVEVALKMAIQFYFNKGESRKKILAFENAYHGDTFGAMAVGGRSTFNAPFEEMFFEVDFIPYPVPGSEEECLAILNKFLENNAYAAFIMEPLVQGSAGMIMAKPEAFDSITIQCRKNGAIIIADEVFTGMGRTGTLFACDQLNEHADIVCISKGITGGFLPLGLTTCKGFIYDAFWSDEKQKALFHGHSYTANPIACAAACASLDLFEQEETLRSIRRISEQHLLFAERIKNSENFSDVRCCGTILAIEIKTESGTSYFNDLRDKLYRHFMKKGLLMRPLGNVIYLVPPYCTSNADLEEAYAAISELASQPLISLL